MFCTMEIGLHYPATPEFKDTELHGKHKAAFGTGGSVQWVLRLLCRHEDLNLNP